jgi:hypothetical protein
LEVIADKERLYFNEELRRHTKLSYFDLKGPAMKCNKLSFAVVFVPFALLSLSTGTLNARDADLGSPTFAAAHTAKQQCINSCRARYRDCRYTKIADVTLVMLVQLVDRPGQGFRRN